MERRLLCSPATIRSKFAMQLSASSARHLPWRMSRFIFLVYLAKPHLVLLLNSTCGKTNKQSRPTWSLCFPQIEISISTQVLSNYSYHNHWASLVLRLYRLHLCKFSKGAKRHKGLAKYGISDGKCHVTRRVVINRHYPLALALFGSQEYSCHP